MGQANEHPAAEIRSLVRSARDGDARAFRRIVELFMRSIYALGYRMMGNHDDADEIAQETFVRAYQALERYDERYSLYTWLRTIATRVALNELEKRRRRRTEGGERFETTAQTVQDPTADPLQDLEAADTRQRLQNAMQALPEDFRTVLILRTYEELSYEEIAQLLEVPLGTVMSRLHRARSQLRTALTTQDAGVHARREDCEP